MRNIKLYEYYIKMIKIDFILMKMQKIIRKQCNRILKYGPGIQFSLLSLLTVDGKLSVYIFCLNI